MTEGRAFLLCKLSSADLFDLKERSYGVRSEIIGEKFC